ncbi:transposase [Bradyrhizobium sp. RDI18]|uniref:transposase n=1 Tax=Bradyrhizobium sp. RDI18 TaxID=3367400 RepID=UPI003711C5D3
MDNIANSRLISLADGKVSFSWKDYRQNHKAKVMTLDADQFIRRFLLHTLPDGFHRIRHYGFLAYGGRNDKIALCRQLLAVRNAPADQQAGVDPKCEIPVCPHCGGTMRRVDVVPQAGARDSRFVVTRHDQRLHHPPVP